MELGHDQFLKEGGEIRGKLHSEGGEGYINGNGERIELEHLEFVIPYFALDQKARYTFEGTNKEVIEQIAKVVEGGMSLPSDEKVKVIRSGDAVICRDAYLDKTKRHYQGTIPHILSQMQQIHGCKIINGNPDHVLEKETEDFHPDQVYIHEKEMGKGGDLDNMNEENEEEEIDYTSLIFEMRKGGSVKKKIEKKDEYWKFDLPDKTVLQFGRKIKNNYPKVWFLGGNEFGNEAFKNLYKVSNRGEWLPEEEWMYKKWKSFLARHYKDFRIAGVMANIKWAGTVEKGFAYMYDLVVDNIKKYYPDSIPEKIFANGGNVSEESDKSNGVSEIGRQLGYNFKNINSSPYSKFIEVLPISELSYYGLPHADDEQLIKEYEQEIEKIGLSYPIIMHYFPKYSMVHVASDPELIVALHNKGMKFVPVVAKMMIGTPPKFSARVLGTTLTQKAIEPSLIGISETDSWKKFQRAVRYYDSLENDSLPYTTEKMVLKLGGKIYQGIREEEIEIRHPEDTLVRIDTNRIWDRFSEDVDLDKLSSERIKSAVEFMSSKEKREGQKVEAPIIYWDKGAIKVENGRHRIIAAHKLQLPYFWAEVPKGEEDFWKREFGYFDPEDLNYGKKVEMEHEETVKKIINDSKMTPEKASELISRDHLAEREDYYDVVKREGL